MTTPHTLTQARLDLVHDEQRFAVPAIKRAAVDWPSLIIIGLPIMTLFFL